MTFVSGDSDPLISIGMPIRNCCKTLRSAVCSILSQTYENWELILIDDASNDGTSAVARSFSDPRVRLVQSEQNWGLPTQLNRAIALSRGKYFARMDGDDVAYPMRLEKQLAYMEAHTDVDLLGTGVIVFDGAGQAIGKRFAPPTHMAICAHPWAGFPISHPTYMGRLAWFKRFGYRRDVVKAQDQDLLLRSFLFSRFANLPETLLGYREEKLDLVKILTSRFYFSRAAFAAFRRQGNLPYAIRSVTEQIPKGIVDIFAMASGLKYKMLSHRVVPISKGEELQWEDLWEKNEAAQDRTHNDC